MTAFIPPPTKEISIGEHEILENLIQQALEYDLIKGQNTHTQACMLAAFLETAGYTKSKE